MVLGHGAVHLSGADLPLEGVILVGITGVAGISTHESRLVCYLQGRTLACGKQAKAECDPRKFVGAAGARDHGSRQRDGIPDPLQQQRDRVSGREAFAAIAVACRRIDGRQDRRVMPVSGGRSARNDIAVTDGRVVWPCGAPPPAVRWVADPSDGLLAPASIGCWSGGPKRLRPDRKCSRHQEPADGSPVVIRCAGGRALLPSGTGFCRRDRR